MGHRKSRRISPSSGYIGAGNRTSAFSRKARKPFEDLADIYIKEAKNIKGGDAKSAFEQLSESDKKNIRAKIIQRKKAQKRKYILALFFSILITAIIGFLITWLIKTYF